MIKRLRNNPDYLKGVVSAYGVMGLNILAQVLLVPLYLKFLGKYQFGILMILFSLINYAAVSVTWMSGRLVRLLGERAAHDDKEGFARAYWASKIIYVGYALAVALVAVGGSMIWNRQFLGNIPGEFQSQVEWSILIAGLYFVLLYESILEAQAFTAWKRQTTGNVINALRILFFVAGVIPWLLSGGGLRGVLVCMVVGVVAARLFSLYFWKALGSPPFLSSPRKEILGFWKQLTGSMNWGFVVYGFFHLGLQADVLIIGWLGGPSVVADYVIVWKIAEVGILVIWRAAEYLQPYIIHMDAKKKVEGLKSLYEEAWHWTFITALAAAVAYSFFGNSLVALWVGPENAPDAPSGYLLAGAAVFWLGCARVPSVFAYSLVRFRFLNRVMGLEFGLKLLLILLLFPSMSYLAPLLAITLVHAGGAFFLYRRMIRFPSD